MKNNLSAILILSDPFSVIAKKRSKRAYVEFCKEFENPYGFVIVSGGRTFNQIPDSYLTYKELKKLGLKLSDIKAETKSVDTVENILFSCQKFSKLRKLGIVSNPSHLNRAERIIQQAKEKGKINSKIKIEKLETAYSLAERIFEISARCMANYQLEKDLKSQREQGKFFQILKKLFNYTIHPLRYIGN